MTAILLDGKAIARQIREGTKQRVTALRKRTGVTPALAVIIVGKSCLAALVNNKIKACAEVGIRSARHEFPADVDAATVIERIKELNADRDMHGILVQLPLPAHHDIHAVLRTVAVRRMSTASTCTMWAAWCWARPCFRPARPTA